MPMANIIAIAAAKLRSLKITGGMNGLLGGEHMDDEQVEAESRQHRLDDDLARGEPVLVLAAIQHHLERADAERQHAEAGPVEAQLGIGAGFAA